MKKSDILWYNSSTGETQVWYMNVDRLVDRGTVVDENGNFIPIGPPFSIVGVGDMDGNGKADIVWYNSQTGETQVWYMDGHRLVGRGTVVDEGGNFIPIGPPFSIVGVGDMDGRGKADIVWYNSQTGETQVWYMDGHRLVGRGTVVDEGGNFIPIGPPFSIVGVGDMDGRGKADIVWYNSQTGETQVWYMDGHRLVGRGTVVDEGGNFIPIGPPFSIVGVGDMDGRGKADIVWYNSQTGETQVWYMDGHGIITRKTLLGLDGNAVFIGPPWSIVGTGLFGPAIPPKGVDPALCPIPPGFEVIGGFNDDFRHFKNGTGYENFKGDDGIHNYGVSKRWRNPNIRSAGIVCGFQFKIGPTIGSRFIITQDPVTKQTKAEFLGEVDSGDISLHFPRRERTGGDRGGYIVSLKWYRDNFNDDGSITEAKLDKEIPHSTYGGVNRFREHDFVRDRQNPRSIEKTQIRDGQWHSFLAVIYNDWHRSGVSGSAGTSEQFPIIGLWYSHVPTTDFKDFKLMGMGADNGNMPPRGPLKEAIGHDQHPIIDLDDLLDFPDDIHELVGKLDDIFLPGVGSIINLFGGDVVGDDLFVAEHALQIRIDDVPLNEIEIRNVYAASVNYIGISPPQGHPLCGAKAKAIIDAQANIENLQRKANEALENRNKHPPLGLGSEQWRIWDEIHNNLTTVEIPNAKSDLRAAEFLYGRCIEEGDA